MPRQYSEYRYFVYELWIDGDTTPFYIGKGTGTRPDQHAIEFRRGCRCRKCKAFHLAAELGLAISVRIVFESNDEDAVLANERSRIVGAMPGSLTNAIQYGHHPVKPAQKPIQLLRSAPMGRQARKERWREQQAKIMAERLGDHTYDDF